MTSADKFGVLFTIVFTAAFIGIAVGLSSDASISDRPGVEQEAFVAKPPPPPPKPVEKEMTPVTPGTTTVSEPEYCWVEDPITGEKLKDGIDNDLDGLIDEPDPLPGMPLGPHPGVDWDYCDLDWYDFSGMDLSDATIRHATAIGTIFRDTILDNAQFGHNPADFTIRHPHTDATKAFFTNSKGDNVNFERTTLNGANFDTAKMQQKGQIEIDELKIHKNQLEIEKNNLEEKYESLVQELKESQKKIEEFENNKKKDNQKQNEFNQKIDELNQETEYLIEEIDKWQI